jgi:hypothetical protein
VEGVGVVESSWRAYSAVSDQIQNLQNLSTTPRQKGMGPQTDEYLPQSPFQVTILEDDLYIAFYQSNLSTLYPEIWSKNTVFTVQYI